MLTQGRKLAAKNFRVLLPDAANHGERKTKTSEIPSLTFWDSIQTNLYEFGFWWIILKPWIGHGENRSGGISMGGITTCMLLTQHPEINVAACVMGSPAPIKYRERIAMHAGELGFYLPKDYRQWLRFHMPVTLMKDVN